jgi:hypothetical protein
MQEPGPGRNAFRNSEIGGAPAIASSPLRGGVRSSSMSTCQACRRPVPTVRVTQMQNIAM